MYADRPPPLAADRPVVLITGASSGIGRAAALEIARRMDAHLVLAARRSSELHATELLIGSNARCVPCDLTSTDDVDRLVRTVRDEFGRLDVLVNNAGAGSAVEFESPDSPADIDRLLALNVRAPMLLTHQLADLLERSRGVIVNVSSVAGFIGTPNSPVYSATKWALTGFSEAMRSRLAPRGISVVCVQPGPVPTPGWPHERLRTRRVIGAVLTCDAQVIARVIADAAQRRGGPAPVRPRIYAAIPLIRAIAPWLVRRALIRVSTKA